jgi:hypothetical protein
MNDRRTALADSAILILCASLFTLLPRLVSGIPLRQQLSSDAEWYAVEIDQAVHPELYARDRSFSPDIRQTAEFAVDKGLAAIARVLYIDLLEWSVMLSFGALLVFVLGVYFLMRRSLHNRAFALLIAGVLIIPVHTLGGDTLGFQALGYLPRDMALAFVPFVLMLYLKAVREESLTWLAATCFACGVLSNYYLLLFPHLCATLLLAEVIRGRRIRLAHVGCGLLFMVAAGPALVDGFSRPATPVDWDILRMRLAWMMAWPPLDAVRRYLRRFLIASAVIAALWPVVRRDGTDDDRRRLAPWFAISAAALVLAVIGVYVETATVATKYLISRASIFLMLAAMPIACVGFAVLGRRVDRRRASQLAVMAAAVLFLGQSNLPTIYRFVRDDRAHRDERRRFLEAVDRLKALTPVDAVVAAPSPEDNDLAASLRTYAQRAVYVTYKDGGVAIVDGNRARQWLARYEKLQQALHAIEPGAFMRFMRDEGVDYALLPDSLPPATDPEVRAAIVERSGRFLIIRARPSGSPSSGALSSQRP